MKQKNSIKVFDDKMVKSDWTFVAGINLDEEDDPKEAMETKKIMLQYEKMKYKKQVAPMIKRLEDQIKKKEEMKIPADFLKTLYEEKQNGRTLTIEYENGDVYPKEVKPPVIVYISFPEPHVLITDKSDANEDWYRLSNIIPDFANEAYLTYELGCWLASISSSINCCEYILKYELFKKLKATDPNKLQEAKEARLMLGVLINDKKLDCLGLLGIPQFHDALEHLNNIRIAIYHANNEKAKRVRQKGQVEVERTAPITDDLAIPMHAYNAYDIMLMLINHFYNREKALEYYKEGVADWKKKRGLKNK